MTRVIKGDEMNYEPNTTQWKTGDIVIHDADGKMRLSIYMTQRGLN